MSVSSQGEKGKRGRGKACQRGPPGIPGLRGLDVIRHLHTHISIPNTIATASIHNVSIFNFFYIWCAPCRGNWERRARREKKASQDSVYVYGCYAGLQMYISWWLYRHFYFCLGGGCEGTSDEGGGWEVWYVCMCTVCICVSTVLKISRQPNLTFFWSSLDKKVYISTKSRLSSNPVLCVFFEGYVYGWS